MAEDPKAGIVAPAELMIGANDGANDLFQPL
jgi:hypothetical protein